MSLINSTGLSEGVGLNWSSGLYGGEGLAKSYSNEANQFFARISDPGVAQKLKYSNLIDSLVTAGVWSKLDAIYTFAAPIEATALVNLKSSSFDATLINTPTFTAYRGFTTNGTDNAIITLNPVSAAGNFVQNSACFGLWNRSNTQQGNANGTEDTLTNATFNNPRNTGDAYGIRINCSASTSVANANGLGFYVVSRVAAGSQQGFKNGLQVVTAANASTGVANANLCLGKGNNSFSAREFAVGVVGGGLTAPEHALLYNSLLIYMQAVGAA